MLKGVDEVLPIFFAFFVRIGGGGGGVGGGESPKFFFLGCVGVGFFLNCVLESR